MANVHEVKAVHDSILNHIHKIRMKVDPKYAEEHKDKLGGVFDDIFAEEGAE